jgi:hypothetical protein
MPNRLKPEPRNDHSPPLHTPHAQSDLTRPEYVVILIAWERALNAVGIADE